MFTSPGITGSHKYKTAYRPLFLIVGKKKYDCKLLPKQQTFETIIHFLISNYKNHGYLINYYPILVWKIKILYYQIEIIGEIGL